MSGDPIEGQILLVAAAKASVPPARLPTLVDRVQADLAPRRGRYRREYERVHADADREAFLVDPDHWTDVGDRLEFERRETDAVRRAHEEQLLRIARRTDREEELEHALEIRDPLLVGVGGGEPGDDGRNDDEPQ